MKSVSVTAQRTKNKKLGKQEDFLKQTSRELSFTKMKSTVLVSVTLLTLYSLMTSIYDGVVIAKIPFQPFGILKGVSHRGLAGDDFTDCSMAFIYVLCSISFRVNVQKMLGFAPPRTQATGPFGAHPSSPF